jgi:hypothetical protein
LPGGPAAGVRAFAILALSAPSSGPPPLHMRLHKSGLPIRNNS